jgi:glycosyltransferase involved in cell wall biosynthesis
MRVLEMLVTTSPGGGPRHVWDLARHLPTDEFELVVAAPRDGIFFDRFRDLGLRVIEFPLRRLGVRHFQLAARTIRGLAIDVVHTHGKGPGLYGRVVARLCGVPAVHTFHGIHYETYGRARRLYFALERQLSRVTATVINVSASEQAEGLRLGLFTPEQAVVVLNGVDLDEIARTIIDAPIRREQLGLGAADVVLGCISRFDPVKRIGLLLEVLGGLSPRLPRLALVLVGGGGEEQHIRRHVLQAGLAAQVIFTGFLDNPVRICPALDVYVAASRKEGLPLSLAEAMAAGVPIVASDVPGHRDVIVENETGLLVASDDPGAMADAIASLAADPERRARMAAAGRKLARDRFNVTATAQATADIYRRVAISSAAGVTARKGDSWRAA